VNPFFRGRWSWQDEKFYLLLKQADDHSFMHYAQESRLLMMEAGFLTCPTGFCRSTITGEVDRSQYPEDQKSNGLLILTPVIARID
jgi:hypothetical protein